MDCPVCIKSPMVTLELNEIEVDFCFQCKGIWLDEGELELLMDNQKQAVELLKSFKTESNLNEARRKCPICLKKMVKISAGKDNKTVILDKCKNNHGLWFDENELTEILESANLDPENKVQNLLKEIFAQDIN